ncbi:hypothetical protein RND81_09G178000 [Saponaria officinalis]|uniref:non-specific serine/threonine protein kinase n=1 Tax=Saponaria officinalis TaxID=3572 RepID=A0AAW1IM63_SAPOF
MLRRVLFCASAFLVCCIHFCTAYNVETDRQALLDFKKQINEDPLGVLSAWNESVPVCSWQGVSCGRKHPRVTSLNLDSCKLAGTISPSIGNLTFLSLLNLNNNSFVGNFPAEITRLFRLEFLWLSYNSLEGELPSNITLLSNLNVLDVYSNRLSGGIPSELGSLLYLQKLALSYNHFTGTIPASLGNLSYLNILEIQQTNLTGSIPNSFGRLTNLVILKLDTNNLYGVVPPSVFNLSALQMLDLGSNHFQGSLPSDLGNMLPNLQYFVIDHNSISGSIPASISNASNLVTLIMAHNQLEGQVPSLHGLEKLQNLVLFDNKLGIGDPATDLDFVYSLANSTMLTRFVVGNNKLSGKFPRIFCDFPMLSQLIAGQNQITGEIPFCIGNLTQLTYFDVRENNISGVIPHSIGRLHALYTFFLADNQLSGHIPSSIGNLTQLTQFVVYGNNLEGDIPSSLGNCRNLLALDLSSNNLSGEIPAQVLRLSTLSITLDLSNNRLTGPLPDEVGGLVNLQNLFVSDNLLSGEIPSTLGSCVELEGLYMQGNFFQGLIPKALAYTSLRSLQFLDLSRNNLSGNIPESLQGLHLKLLNLSYNNLQGEVPTLAVFSNATGFSILGNAKLCGGPPALQLHHCKGSHKNHYKMALLLGIPGLVIVLVAIVSLYTVFHNKGAKTPTDMEKASTNLSLYTIFPRLRSKETPLSDLEKALTNLSYQMLHQATDGFSSENLIGSGASGMVYKGTLEDVKTVLAIKIFNLEHRAASKSFIAECKALRSIRHRNLIKVITACSSLDYKGNDFKAIVYEYMAKGSLDDWLHPSHGITRADNSDDAPRNLNLRQRLEIAIDVAFALEYLHHNCGSSVIHCDLKPSNVLLDEDMVAHVGDFGLAKFLSQGILSENQSSSMGVRGTVGYAPPEYGMGNEISICGDVYSFGILLLEMFTGKRPTDGVFKEGRSLRDFVNAAISEQDIGIVDDALLQDMATEDSSSQIVFEAVISVLETGLACSVELPQERPDMTDIVEKLSSIQTRLQGRRTQQ